MANLYTPCLSILFFVATIPIMGCEGYSCAKGTVKDKATELPLDSVQVKVITNDNAIKYTDADGKYDVCNGFGGCVPKCRDIMVEFSKTGYKTITTDQSNSSGTIYLEKQ